MDTGGRVVSVLAHYLQWLGMYACMLHEAQNPYSLLDPVFVHIQAHSQRICSAPPALRHSRHEQVRSGHVWSTCLAGMES